MFHWSKMLWPYVSLIQERSHWSCVRHSTLIVCKVWSRICKVLIGLTLSHLSDLIRWVSSIGDWGSKVVLRGLDFRHASIHRNHPIMSIFVNLYRPETRLCLRLDISRQDPQKLWGVAWCQLYAEWVCCRQEMMFSSLSVPSKSSLSSFHVDLIAAVCFSCLLGIFNSIQFYLYSVY